MPFYADSVTDYIMLSTQRQPIWVWPSYKAACELLGDNELLETAIKLEEEYYKISKRAERLADAIRYRCEHQKDKAGWILP